jgi:RNA polymerase sigma-70 factor (ECF subfamily)
VAGERAALSQLLLNHYDSLRRLIAARIAGDLDRWLLADDLLHQTFVRAAQSIRRFEPQHPGSFRGWLKTIAENLIKDARKRRRRERRAGESPGPAPTASSSGSWAALVERLAGDSTAPSGRAQRRESARRLQAAVTSLPADQRDVIERVYLRDESFEQVAAATGRTKDAVRGLCYRARRSLRALLGGSSLYFSG